MEKFIYYYRLYKIIKMAEKKTKSMNIYVSDKGGAFSYIFGRFKSDKKSTEIAKLRNILSDEKARLLHVAKTKEPESIYHLAKLLGRDFKAVRHDIRLLEEFGFIELITSHKKGRERLRPIVDVDELVITINLN